MELTDDQAQYLTSTGCPAGGTYWISISMLGSRLLGNRNTFTDQKF